MARDRFICFKKTIPTKDQLKMILEDYLGGLAVVEYDDMLEDGNNVKNYWFVKLPGKPSFPFASKINPLCPADRWFEVYVGQLNQDKEVAYGPNIDVMTRGADELTNVIADGYANLIARYFDADIA
jgi:hypothetical protein